VTEARNRAGTLAASPRFLAIKLIKGRTPEAILKQRPDPLADRGRLLAIFDPQYNAFVSAVVPA